MFSVIVAEVKFKQIYTCKSCGLKQAGDTRRATIQCHTPQGLVADYKAYLIIQLIDNIVNKLMLKLFKFGYQCPKCLGKEGEY